ncbi:hypothetical protein OQA88_7845 [Cercophora sp. LCS_1]
MDGFIFPTNASMKITTSYNLTANKTITSPKEKRETTSRNICITSADGQTGFLIAELLLSNDQFRSKITSVTCLVLDPSSPKAKELERLGAATIAHKHGREREVVAALKKTGCDTLCPVPPAHKDKLDTAIELANAAKKAGTV